MAVRIRHSSWATRIWTMQEGRLGKQLCFQFKDKAVSTHVIEAIIQINDSLTIAFGLLGQLKEDQIMSNESAIRLLRALASELEPTTDLTCYESMQVQDDPELEELRQAALDIIKERKGNQPILDTWQPLIEVYRLQHNLDGKDERLLMNLRNWRIDLVASYGIRGMMKARGYGYQALVQSGEALSQDSFYISSGLLIDICQGFQGRTTSRLEDETICLAILLRLKDMKALLDVNPLPWRWKKVFQLLDAGATKFSWILSRCQEERMKRLFLQMEAFEQEPFMKSIQRRGAARTEPLRRYNGVPTIMIFWNLTRLKSWGWKWAPLSILHTELRVTGSQYGPVTRYGLEVQFSAFTLSLLGGKAPVESQTGLTVISDHRKEVLVIHTEHDHDLDAHPWRKSWQRVRLRQDDMTRQHKSQPSLASWIRDGLIEQMTLLVEPDDREEFGCMVQAYGKDGDVGLATHVGLLERVAKQDQTPSTTHEIHVWGEWTARPKWPIG
ncbi:MAG: hypothetical protein M1820_004381 [Bogoriella megaspora]|nr:MAG: hypothetical protein M1820_004381 [Bogoriella megaspora]